MLPCTTNALQMRIEVAAAPTVTCDGNSAALFWNGGNGDVRDVCLV